jgi:hypothetical protein
MLYKNQAQRDQALYYIRPKTAAESEGAPSDLHPEKAVI